MTLKIGDKVKFVKKSNGYNYNAILGLEFVIKHIEENYKVWSDKEWFFEQDLKLIKNNMNIKEKFITAFLGEPEKSFRKTGITNGDGFLTEDGQEVFLGWLLKQNGPQFKTDVVDDLLKEQEKDK
jgi:hypothetical protein